MSLMERFNRLPEEQQLRNEESARQAQEASELLKRLKATREEAEKVAMEEIERTRRIQREEIEMHPEVVDLKRRLSTAQMEKDIWERKMRDAEKRREKEVETLKKQEDLLMRRFNEAQESELQSQRDYEKRRNEREAKEFRFKELEQQLQNVHREEEFQFQSDSEALKKQINELEGHFGDQKEKERKLKSIEDEIRANQDAIDRVENAREDLREKEGRLAEDLLKAQSLVNDAKNIVDQKEEQVGMLRGETNNYEKAQNDVYQAQKRIADLESSSKSFDSDRNRLKAAIDAKDARIKGLIQEIERLQQELETAQNSHIDDYNALYDLENQARQHEIDLKDAKQFYREAVDRRDFFAQERRRFGDFERDLEEAKSTLHEAQNEERRAFELIEQIRMRVEDYTKDFNDRSERLRNLNNEALNLRASTGIGQDLPSQIEEKKRNLSQVAEKWGEWRINRLRPLQEEFDSLRSWLSANPFPESAPIKHVRSESIWNDLERCRARIRDLQSSNKSLPEPTFEDAEKLQSLIAQKEAQIQAKLMTKSGLASQRFVTQLEREAEALMRAEIAATHEQKQAAIEKDANELSQLRLALKPKVELDSEAQRRLWMVNKESEGTGRIADSIIDLCRNQNITLKQ